MRSTTHSRWTEVVRMIIRKFILHFCLLMVLGRFGKIQTKKNCSWRKMPLTEITGLISGFFYFRFLVPAWPLQLVKTVLRVINPRSMAIVVKKKKIQPENDSRQAMTLEGRKLCQNFNFFTFIVTSQARSSRLFINAHRRASYGIYCFAWFSFCFTFVFTFLFLF